MQLVVIQEDEDVIYESCLLYNKSSEMRFMVSFDDLPEVAVTITEVFFFRIKSLNTGIVFYI
jgi:hypothetical protein